MKNSSYSPREKSHLSLLISTMSQTVLRFHSLQSQVLKWTFIINFYRDMNGWKDFNPNNLYSYCVSEIHSTLISPSLIFQIKHYSAELSMTNPWTITDSSRRPHEDDDENKSIKRCDVECWMWMYLMSFIFCVFVSSVGIVKEEAVLRSVVFSALRTDTAGPQELDRSERTRGQTWGDITQLKLSIILHVFR